MCAERVARFLVNMVKEDMLLEKAAARARHDREQWGTRALKRAMPKGCYLDSMQID